MPYSLDDFDFALPQELIAQHPAHERSASRLLDARCAAPRDRVFREIPTLLNEGDLLVFNDTRVIKARLFGRKASGGAVEALVERVLPEHHVLAHLRASKAPRPGSVLRLAGAFDAEVLGRGNARDESQHPEHAQAGTSSPVGNVDARQTAVPHESLYKLRFPEEPLALLERHGHLPLPPYIRHADDADDQRRYQTVFARNPGAVAAPTAALHFDELLLNGLQERAIGRAFVTLHVGSGTFAPVRVHDLARHRMHSEWFEVGPEVVRAVERTKAGGGRIVAVGTTVLRALETAALGGVLRACHGETDIFITPGFGFRVVDQLVTNFHLPKSTLMMLVSAFAGFERIRQVYAHAIAARYRFFSYGDAMLLDRASPPAA